MDTKIKKLLDSNKVKYEILEHRTVYTAFNAAETQHIDVKQVVKTVLVKFSKPVTHLGKDGKLFTVEMVLVALPAGKRVDLKKVAKFANDYVTKEYKAIAKLFPKFKKQAQVTCKLASEKDITKKLKTKIGLIAPFGEAFGLPVLMDKKLATNKKLIVSAGSYTESISLSVKDYIKLASPTTGNFIE